MRQPKGCLFHLLKSAVCAPLTSCISIKCGDGAQRLVPGGDSIPLISTNEKGRLCACLFSLLRTLAHSIIAAGKLPLSQADEKQPLSTVSDRDRGCFLFGFALSRGAWASAPIVFADQASFSLRRCLSARYAPSAITPRPALYSIGEASETPVSTVPSSVF